MSGPPQPDAPVPSPRLFEPEGSSDPSDPSNPSDPSPDGPDSGPALVAVAVPVPLPDPLTYKVPEAYRPLARPGARVRVRVGPRRLVGFIVGHPEAGPEGVTLRPLEEVVDREPVVPEDLLELARFTADYYRAPLGEVLRSMLPGDLPPWGHQRLRLTSGGAVAPPRTAREKAVLEALLEAGRLTAGELQGRLGGADLPALLDRMVDDGRLVAEAGRRKTGTRYPSAVELASGDLESHLEAAGRSAQGREVVELLAALGRPAKVEEITEEVGCGPGVVRRLVKLGVLKKFTQVERISLDHHLLGAPGERPEIVLRPDQDEAVTALGEALEAETFAPFLLHGMTGSGKTEVYLRAARKALDSGRSAVLLVPEIALVPALAREARSRFGDEVALLHSNLGATERHQEWERIRRGRARVVVGPRSALFAPVPRLGLLVVDEEQDPSYKQDSTPRYHGRDLSLVRGRSAGAVVVLASATPSLESRHNAGNGKLTRLALTQRVGHGRLPEGILVDLKDEEGAVRRAGEITFSQRLREEIRQAHREGEQMILLRNRRGYAPTLLCRACGEDHRCPHCGLPRTWHRRDQVLLCHYCGSDAPVPEKCTICGEEALEPMGSGTERVEETFAELFPDIPVAVLDRDTARKKGGAAAVLARFASGETRALVGTQMVSKGHHFPNVSLTAVLSADTYLGFADFRAVERTYTLLTQLAGRAGRGERPGRVVIQTFHPEHYAIQAALAHDDERFAREEMHFRRVFHYPPFTRLVQVLVRGEDQDQTENLIGTLAKRFWKEIERYPPNDRIRLTGPAPAPFERLRDQWRFQLLLRHSSAGRLQELLDRVQPAASGVRGKVEVVVDVDPYDLL